MAACADAIAAPLDDVVMPTTSQLDIAMTGASHHHYDSTPAFRQLWILAQNLADSHGKLEVNKFAAKLAVDPVAISQGATAAVLHGSPPGKPRREAARSLHHRQCSFGSTAAVRALAASLLPTPLPIIADIASRSAAITHAHPAAHATAALIGCATALEMQGKPDPEMTARRVPAVGQQLRPTT
jgi:ADP-ribosylglycohydrolase